MTQACSSLDIIVILYVYHIEFVFVCQAMVGEMQLQRFKLKIIQNMEITYIVILTTLALDYLL